MQGFTHKYLKVEEYAAANVEAERVLRQSQRNVEKAKQINKR